MMPSTKPHADQQPTHALHALPAGGTLLANDLVEFRIWAPHAESVSVVLRENEDSPPQEHALQAEGSTGYFRCRVAGLAGTRYRYRIRNRDGEELLVPDPYARSQTLDVHGESVVHNPLSYAWKTEDWQGKPWHETILYELHVGLLGGYRGVQQHLPALAALGITAIELMPLASFPGDRNWGYDGVLQFAPQSSYGSPDELKALIDEAHSLGISVFLDVVYNHFGPDGNYLYHYAPQFFCDDRHTPWGKAINYALPEVRAFFISNALYWLQEFRFDGLRFDACHAIWDKSLLEEIASSVNQTFAGLRHVHLVAENDDNAVNLLQSGFVAQWNDDSHHVLHVLLTGETEGYYSDYAEQASARLARCLREGFIYQGEPSPHRGGTPRGEASASLPPTAFVNFMQNHDQIGNRPFGERLIDLADERALHAASALLLLSPAIPMLFMGEEYGAENPFYYFTSHTDPELAKAVCEGRRREFSGFSKFSDPTLVEQIPDPNAWKTYQESAPLEPASNNAAHSQWRQWYQHLLQLRHQFLLPVLEHCKAVHAEAMGPSAVYARWQLTSQRQLAIAVNLGQQAVEMDWATLSPGESTIILDYADAAAGLQQGQLPATSFIAIFDKSV